jgi:hypothetical protein
MAVNERQKGTSGSEWVEFKKWSGGTGRLETEKFVTAGDRWRVTWKTTTGDPDPLGSISIAVRTGAGKLVTLANNLGQKITSGSIDVLSKPGEHYLEIESADRNWDVAAEQPSQTG